MGEGRREPVKAKSFSIKVLFFFLFIVKVAWGDNVFMEIFPQDSDIEMKIQSSFDRRLILPFFKRDIAPLIIVIFEDGTLIQDLHWQKPRSDFSKATCFSTRVFSIRAHEEHQFILGIFGCRRFDLSRSGRYFVSCYLKKEKKSADGLWFSNLLLINVKDGKLLGGKDISKEALPIEVKQTLNSEIDKVYFEEKLGKYFFNK